jgi:hypothetical protein
MDTISAPKTDEMADRQQRIQIFQLIMQNLPVIQQSKIPINIAELFRWLLDSFGEKDISRFMSAPPEQMQGGDEQPNTALNLQSQSNANPPSVINSAQLRNQLAGAQSGGGFNINPSGGIQ